MDKVLCYLHHPSYTHTDTHRVRHTHKLERSKLLSHLLDFNLAFFILPHLLHMLCLSNDWGFHNLLSEWLRRVALCQAAGDGWSTNTEKDTKE